MAFYTICAADRLRVLRPCSVHVGMTGMDVLRRFEQDRRIGHYAFLPDSPRITVRRSSRRETEAYRAWIEQQGPVPMADTDPGRAGRIARLEAAFSAKIWREGVR